MTIKAIIQILLCMTVFYIGGCANKYEELDGRKFKLAWETAHLGSASSWSYHGEKNGFHYFSLNTAGLTNDYYKVGTKEIKVNLNKPKKFTSDNNLWLSLKESQVVGIYDRHSILPPDPGEAGEATLVGIDSDGDGVRDDVQRKLSFEFPDSELRLHDNLNEAKELQQVFSVYKDKQLSRDHYKSASIYKNNFYDARRASCFIEFLANDLSDSNFNKWYSLWSQHEAVGAVMNTEARRKAYRRYLENIHCGSTDEAIANMKRLRGHGYESCAT